MHFTYLFNVISFFIVWTVSQEQIANILNYLCYQKSRCSKKNVTSVVDYMCDILLCINMRFMSHCNGIISYEDCNPHLSHFFRFFQLCICFFC